MPPQQRWPLILAPRPAQALAVAAAVDGLLHPPASLRLLPADGARAARAV